MSFQDERLGFVEQISCSQVEVFKGANLERNCSFGLHSALSVFSEGKTKDGS